MEVINECLNDFKDNAVFTEESEDDALQDAGISLNLQAISEFLKNSS